MLKTIATRSIVFIVFIVLIQMLMTPVLSNEKTSEKQEAFHFSEKQKKHRFFSHYFKKFDLEDQKQFPQKDSLLCIGSSSMLYWRTISRDLAPLKTTHRGFGGSNMGDVLEFKDFFLRYNADRILIYEGDNDLWGSTSPEKFKFSSITREDAVPIKDIKFSTPPELKTIDFGVLFDKEHRYTFYSIYVFKNV